MRFLPIAFFLAISAVAACAERPQEHKVVLGTVQRGSATIVFTATILDQQSQDAGLAARLVVSGTSAERSALLFHTVCFLKVENEAGRMIETIDEREATGSEAEMRSRCKNIDETSCGADLRATRVAVRESSAGKRVGAEALRPGNYLVTPTCWPLVGDARSASGAKEELASEAVSVRLQK
jgi:hypothetical protein